MKQKELDANKSANDISQMDDKQGGTKNLKRIELTPVKEKPKILKQPATSSTKNTKQPSKRNPTPIKKQTPKNSPRIIDNNNNDDIKSEEFINLDETLTPNQDIRMIKKAVA